MRGRTVPLSLSQRLAVDLLRFAADVPSVTEGRRMNLSAVIAARARNAERPRWMAIFTKACAMVADEIPELRRVYLPWPWPRFYEYPTSVAMILIRRDLDGELFHFNLMIRNPAAQSLVEIDRRITHADQQPKEQVQDFRKAVEIARLPTTLRRCLMWLGYNIGRQRPRHFGTFAVTVPPDGRVSGWLSAWPVRLSYGRIADDGAVDVKVTVDHRVVDGPTGARVLVRLEEILKGPIVEELRGQRANQN